MGRTNGSSQRLATNTANACRAAVLAGGGLAMLTDFSIRDDIDSGRLVRVLPAWAPAESDIHAVFPSTRHMPPKVRAFLDEIRNVPVLQNGAGAAQPLQS
ncbi:hypothetical protein CDEF62S_01565 [Castellaniella defragrans]